MRRERTLTDIIRDHEREILRLKQSLARTGAGVDHGTLSGLGDDDHSQYHNDTRGDARYLKLTGGVLSGLLEAPDYQFTGTAGAIKDTDGINRIIVWEFTTEFKDYQDVQRMLINNAGVTVGDGTAAAPGIRLTTNAHGLYRYDANNIGIAANGGAAILASTGGVTVMGDYLYFNGTTGTEYIQFSDASNWARIVLDGSEHFRVNTNGQALTGNGSASLPSHSFVGDPNTGMYRVAENQLGFVSAGSLKFQIDNYLYNNVVGGAAMYAGAGTASTPGFTFAGDVDLGIYRNAADQGGFSAAGDVVVLWQQPGYNVGSVARGKGALWVYSNDAGGLGTTAGNNIILQSWHASDSNQAELRLELLRDVNGSSWTTSAWGFRRITDSTAQGSFWIKGSSFGINTSGPASTLHVNGTFRFNAPSIGGSAAYLYNRGGGQYELSLASSSIRHKRDLTKFKARPLGAFHFYNENSEAWEYGLVAENVQEAMGDDAVAFNDDGEVRDYHDRAVLSNHEQRIADLEAALGL